MTTWRTYRGRGAAGRIVVGIGGLFAAIEIVFILLNLLGANPANALFQFIGSLARALALFFPGLFQTGNATWDMILDYGLAALFWIVLAGFIGRALGR